MEKKDVFKPTGHKDIDELFDRLQSAVSEGELLREEIQKALNQGRVSKSGNVQTEEKNKIDVINVEDEKGHYKKFFKEDPLFRFIESKGYIDELLKGESYFNSVQRNKKYTTNQASKILGIDLKISPTAQEILGEGFRKYLSLQKSGEEYRYDWINLFKMKMLLFISRNIRILSVVEAILAKEAPIPQKEIKSESKQISNHLREDDLSEIINNLHSLTELYNIGLKETGETYKEVLFATMEMDMTIIGESSEKTFIFTDIIRAQTQLSNINELKSTLKEYLEFLEGSKLNHRSKRGILFANQDVPIYDIANRISSINIRLGYLDDEKKELEQTIAEKKLELQKVYERTKIKIAETMKRVFPEQTEA